MRFKTKELKEKYVAEPIRKLMDDLDESNIKESGAIEVPDEVFEKACVNDPLTQRDYVDHIAEQDLDNFTNRMEMEKLQAENEALRDKIASYERYLDFLDKNVPEINFSGATKLFEAMEKYRNE